VFGFYFFIKAITFLFLSRKMMTGQSTAHGLGNKNEVFIRINYNIFRLISALILNHASRINKTNISSPKKWM
jgi:Na+-transporting NADH:ubiquinone oxidoreductase subunit NqrE